MTATERPPLTDEEAAAIRARLAAATEGPHRAAEGDLEGGSLLDYVATLLGNREGDGTSTGRLFLVLGRNSIDPEKGAEVVTALTGDGPQAAANAELIAHAPTDLAALLAERDDLAVENQRLRDTIHRGATTARVNAENARARGRMTDESDWRSIAAFLLDGTLGVSGE